MTRFRSLGKFFLFWICLMLIVVVNNVFIGALAQFNIPKATTMTYVYAYIHVFITSLCGVVLAKIFYWNNSK